MLQKNLLVIALVANTSATYLLATKAIVEVLDLAPYSANNVQQMVGENTSSHLSLCDQLLLLLVH